MPTPPARFAVALIIVEELDTVSSAIVRARIRQTFVYVSLASIASISSSAIAREPSNFINTNSTIETSSNVAIIKIPLTKGSFSSRRTRTLELANQIQANSSILTRIISTLIDIMFTLESLWGTDNCRLT